jgi:N-methylhydantoinase A/oxoprolinase/acetone carboxylase beta subunit
MIPMAELDTIGAGGGSIAHVDDTGMFHVGPSSAGAVPGPACYRRGGTQPTVTDAMLVLGKLRADAFLSGSMPVDVQLAQRALQEHVAEPLGIDLEEAAAITVGVITHSMIQAIELNSVQKGYDPRDFTLVGLGGAGGLFVCDIAAEMGIPRVLVPPHPGITSALGLLTTDTVYESSTTEMTPLDGLDWSRIQRDYERLDARGAEQLRRDGVSDDAVALRRYADCRYANQGYELMVAAPEPVGEPERWCAAVADAFHAEHERTYSRRFDGQVHLVNIRTIAVGRRPPLRWPRLGDGAGPAGAQVHEQEVVFVVDGVRERHHTRFFERSRLGAGDVIEGAAVIEQFDATTVVSPGYGCRVDEHGNLTLERA